MSVLIACEESQAITIEFRKLGIKAFSCDIQDCSGGHPEWHIKDDVVPLLQEEWKMIIAFPPCTDLAISGAAWFDRKRKSGQQQESIDFFMQFPKANSNRIVIENPVGIMSNFYKKPDQIIQPYYFGDSFSKKTCLWLKNLPKLKYTKIVSPGEFIISKSGCKMPKWYADAWNLSPDERAKVRSKTYPGIANAIATQYKDYIDSNFNIQLTM